VAVRDAGVPRASAAPEPPSAPVPLPPPGAYDPASLPWGDCTEEFTPALGDAAPELVECTEVRVDADRAIAGLGGSLSLDLTRVGTGPAPLLVVGESDGEPGTVRAARLAEQLPPAVLDAYTLVGLARRGTGRADPVDCITPQDREEILGADPAPTGPAQLDALLDTTRTAIQTCVQQLNQRLTAITSAATADDLEYLRVALDAPVLNLLAFGDGSRSAVTFLKRYPTSVGRAVLDGAPDPTLDLVGVAEAAAAAAERGFDAFAADCVARRCPLSPDPQRALVELADALRTTPLAVGERQITAGTAYQAVLEAVGDPERWPELAAALAGAAAGDGAGVAELVAPLVTETAGLPARFDPGLATRCNDSATRVPPERAAQLVREWGERYPLFGAMFAQRLLLCSAWPVPASAGDRPDRGAPPPTLVVATEGDPLTPAAGTRRVAEALPSAVLVNWQGMAHGALGRSPCVTDAATAYLMDAQLPAPATLCPP